ncbi:MAG: hypothetical protein BWY63_00271 [Chloroflexi bacterium ADurb.Bin360]|nr:MAG: hypothetical protein BWY63_00271 [Chloroflexi bacterium ADurb.Bin360]
MSGIGAWFGERDKMQSYIPPALLAHAGYALSGTAINQEGNFAGVKVNAANVYDALQEATVGTQSWDPNPYSVAYSYPGLGEGDALMGEFSRALAAVGTRLQVNATGEPPACYQLFSDVPIPEFDDDSTEEAVQEYSARAAQTHDAGIARYKAAMFAQDAHLTSAFYLGLAALHLGKAQDVNTFRGRLFIDQASRKAAVQVEAMRVRLAKEQAKSDAMFRNWQAVAHLNAQIVDATRNIYFANFESARTQYDMDVQYNAAAVGWKYDRVLQYAQLMVPTSGVPLSGPPPTRLERTLAGALSTGSNIGASMGDAFGPVGGIIGALGGGLLGGAAQLLR